MWRRLRRLLKSRHKVYGERRKARKTKDKSKKTKVEFKVPLLTRARVVFR